MSARRCLLSFPWLAALLVAAPPASAAPFVVYDDTLQNGYADWSWATHNLASASSAYSGTAGISADLSAYSGIYFHRNGGLASDPVVAIDLWVRTSGDATLAFLEDGTVVGQATLSALHGSALPLSTWVAIHATTADLGVPPGATPNEIWIQGGASGPIVAVDQIVLDTGVVLPPPGSAITITIDPSQNRRPVSPLIYGVNFGITAGAATYPVNRWGGNATTRYNWEIGTSNRGSDWFFMNIPDGTANAGALPFGSDSDRHVGDSLAAGSIPLMTVPTIGWVPKARTKAWGFSVALYGAQTETECTATNNASWCIADAGNGIRSSNGQPVTGNDPHDTSVEYSSADATAWMAHLAGQFGTASTGGLRHYILDNEPMLWSSTHRDVHPQPLGYDELWQRTLDYATAIKAADPAAETMGPVSWGWCDYFWSAADGCSDGPDKAAHGGVPFLEWYLEQNCLEEQASGTRPVDWLDIHYYPQASGVALSDDESTATAALRLRSVRSLHDAGYVDESWIGTPVRLIPRMKEMIASHCPGMKLSLTEYSWGNDGGMSSALAQVDVLGVFGREGLDLATRWVAPAQGSRVEQAFRLFLDYDGQAGAVAGDSVRATSSSPDEVSVYAVEGSDALFVVLVNKSIAQADVSAAIASLPAGTASLFRFDAATALGPAGLVVVSNGAFDLALPPRSATLVVVPLGATGGTSDGGVDAGTAGSGGTGTGGTSSGTGGTSSSTGGMGAGTGGTGTGGTSSGTGGTSSGTGGVGAGTGGTGDASVGGNGGMDAGSADASTAGSGGTDTRSDASAAGSSGASAGGGSGANAGGSGASGVTEAGAGGSSTGGALGAGSPGGSSGAEGTADASAARGESAASDDGGCGCRVASRSERRSLAWVLALGMMAVMRARRVTVSKRG